MMLDNKPTSPVFTGKRTISRLWLIPMGQGVPLLCDHAEVSAECVRFRVSLDAPVSAGLHCELCSNRPGESTPPGVGVAFNRGVTIGRVEVIEDADGRALSVEARLEGFGTPAAPA